MTLTGRERLRSARHVRAHRSGRPRLADIAYGVYVGVLLAAIIAVPIVRAIVLSLLTEPAQAALYAPSAALALALGAGALLPLAVLAGRTRGPIILPPFQAWALTAIDVRGFLTLLRPLLVSAGIVLVTIKLLASIVALAFALGSGGRAARGAELWFVVCAAAFGVILLVAWLAGQSLPALASRTITGALALLLALTAFAPQTLPWTPWGWLGVAWPGNAQISPAIAQVPIAALALAVVALAAASAIPLLLDRLSPAVAVWQAARWQAALTLAKTGDTSAAFGAFRAEHHWGRGIHLRLSRRPWLAFIARDTVAALRRPARSLVGVVGLVVAGALLGWSAQGTSFGATIATVAAAVGGALLAFLAVGAFCDGLRHAADAAGRPPLIGISVRADAALHTVFPLLVAIVCCGLGGALTGAGTAGIAWPVAVGGFIVALRGMDAAKGPLPIALLMPVPTPVGDASLINVVLWQSDAVLLALLVAGGLTIALASWGFGALLCLVIVTALLVTAAAHRLSVAAAPQQADLELSLA